MRKTLYTALTALLLLSPALSSAAQDSKPAPKADAKAEEIIRKAVEALGGPAYLDVRTVVSEGYFSQYQEGRQTPPLKFIDYLSFPDRERTEFKGGGTRMVQANTGETGWMYEGQSKKLTDVTPAQAADFRTAMRTSLDNILRGWWRKEGASLAYVGRREAGLAMRNEAVRLSYPDGFEVEFEFGARDFLPAKALYKKTNAEGETVEEEDRYGQFLYIGSVRVPFVVDHYRAGTQSSRVNFDKVGFNVQIPDSLFAKPGDLKALLKSLK